MEMEIDWSKFEGETVTCLQAANLNTIEDVLTLTLDEVCKKTGLNYEEVICIFQLLSNMVIKRLRITDYGPKEVLSTGCKNIDQVLGGGIIRGFGITEIAGESGVGKTQLCLQLSIMAQLSPAFGGFSKGVAYVCTEGFPSNRLQQLILNHRATISKLNFGDHIFVERPLNINSLKECLDVKVQSLIDCNKIAVLIVDSIAAIFRADFTYEQRDLRSRELRAVAKRLQIFASKYNICVVCVNQVTACFTDDSNATEKLIPALGLVWASAVTNRIILEKTSKSNIRKFELFSSPYLPSGACNFTVTTSGIADV